MKKQQLSFFNIFFIIFALFFAGCGKNKNNIKKESFFSKVKEKHKNKNQKITEHINGFELGDDESINSFALDDTLPQHRKSSSESAQPTSKGNLFSWENLAAEDSKEQFKKLFFEFDRYHLEPEQSKALKNNISEAKKMIKDGKTIVIEGHACHSAGSAIYNLALSEKRARHVAKKFTDAKIDQNSIKIAPRGQEMPLIKGGSREEQKANRRVEVFAIDTK